MGKGLDSTIERSGEILNLKDASIPWFIMCLPCAAGPAISLLPVDHCELLLSSPGY